MRRWSRTRAASCWQTEATSGASVESLTGGALALSFELWTSVESWALNVGGKPFASVPAFIPVTFELTVLSAALASAAVFFLRSRLFPGKKSAPLPRVTDDRFALVLERDDPAARELLRGAGAVELEAPAHEADCRGGGR